MAILQKSGVTGSLSISSSRLPVSTTGSLLSIDGYNGRLFNVVDTLTGSLFSVNTIAGLPAFEVLSNNTIIGGKYNNNDFVLTGSKLGIGSRVPVYKLDVTGDARTTTNTYLATTSGGVGIKTTSLNNHSLYVNGSLGLAVTTKIANYTATDTDCVILCDTSVGSGGTNITITLPSATGRTGKIYIIKKTTTSANTITILPSSSQPINGATTVPPQISFSTSLGCRIVFCDGTGWWVIAQI